MIRNLRWKKIAVFLLVFVAGVLTGGLVMAKIALKLAAPKQDPTEWTDRVMKRLNGRLKLTPEQQEKVRPIVQNTVSSIIDSRRELIAQAVVRIETAQAELMPILTEGQRRRLEEMQRERAAQFRAWFDSSPPKTE